MDKIYVIWSTYDGPIIEQFMNRHDAESKIAALYAQYAKEHQGFTLLLIVEGVELVATEVSRIKDVRLEKR